jgi:hypothetical protein
MLAWFLRRLLAVAHAFEFLWTFLWINGKEFNLPFHQGLTIQWVAFPGFDRSQPGRLH